MHNSHEPKQDSIKQTKIQITSADPAAIGRRWHLQSRPVSSSLQRLEAQPGMDSETHGIMYHPVTFEACEEIPDRASQKNNTIHNCNFPVGLPEKPKTAGGKPTGKLLIHRGNFLMPQVNPISHKIQKGLTRFCMKAPF